METYLAALSDPQLEDLWNECQISATYNLQDAVLSELLKRPNFCPQDYDLLWELQDAGWNGGCTQDDRDSR